MTRTELNFLLKFKTYRKIWKYQTKKMLDAIGQDAKKTMQISNDK